MAEIDDGELKALRSAHALMDQLMRDPKTRPYQEKLIKAKFPNVTTSEDDPRVQQMRGLSKKVDGFLETQERKEIQNRLDAGFAKLRDKYDYTDEGIEKIKKIMVERKIPDPEDAAAVFQARNPPKQQEPSIYGDTAWNLGQSDDEADDKLL